MSTYTIVPNGYTDTGTIECEDLPRGYSLRYKTEPDYSPDAPWDNEDWHGPVRCLSRHEKPARGETVLWEDRGTTWVYGQGAAFVQAWREGWGLSPEDLQRLTARLGKKPTKGQIRAEAVRQDMAHLRGFLSGDWCYVGVIVELIDPQGKVLDKESLWGIESNSDYWETVAADLAAGLLEDNGLTLAQRGQAWRAALNEARQVKYWACRDVATVSTFA